MILNMIGAMSNFPKYHHAPITEAIIDIRVDPNVETTLEKLKELSEEFQVSFSDIKPMIEATGSMQVRPGLGAVASAQQKYTGYRSVSADTKYVCQRQLQGFTFSRLAPHESW